MESVLILGKIWPEPVSSAAGSRMMQLLKFFLSHNWKVSFACVANKSEFTADLESIGVATYTIELNNISFDSFVKTLQPTFALFDRFTTEEQFGWRVAEHCPSALRILDTEDLHCLRAARQVAINENRQFETNDLVNETAKRELASIYRCDLSLIISEYEMYLLKVFFGVDESLLHYIPFLLDPVTEMESLNWPDFDSRNSFMSIGNFLHAPNWDAVLFLKRDIWPLIRKQLPKAELHIYGAYPTQKVFELNNTKEGFLIRGRTKNVNEVMRKAKVCLAPLRFGAGLKGKLIDAMICGTPNLTTSIGSESMHGELAWSGIVANEPEEIANAAVKLYTDKVAWKQAQENGIKIINELFTKEKHQKELIEKIHVILNSLKEHRRKNFTGAMLLQQTTLSSRYMALWIEAKNKLLTNN